MPQELVEFFWMLQAVGILLAHTHIQLAKVPKSTASEKTPEVQVFSCIPQGP